MDIIIEPGMIQVTVPVSLTSFVDLFWEKGIKGMQPGYKYILDIIYCPYRDINIY